MGVCRWECVDDPAVLGYRGDNVCIFELDGLIMLMVLMFDPRPPGQGHSEGHSLYTAPSHQEPF